jgi:hypothetical protein
VPRPGHGRDPEAEEQRVAVFRRPVFSALVAGFVGFVEGFALFFALDGALLFGGVLDVVGGGGAVSGYDGWGVLVYDTGFCEVELDVPTKVPVEATRKARNGTVRARKEWYLLLAAMTLAAPIAVPMAPPKDPPLTVALYSVSMPSESSPICAKLTCNALALLLS